MKKILIALGILAALVLIPQVSAAYSQPTVTTYCYANGYALGEPNPLMILNCTSSVNFTVYFRTNSSGSWVTSQTTVMERTNHTWVAGQGPVTWQTTSFYGANGSTTTYYWESCLHNNSAAMSTGWTNATYTYQVRELTQGEVMVALIMPFVMLIISVSIIVFFVQGIGKFMKF